MAAAKVVEQLHQDKILPANIPANSPAADAGESNSRDDRKKIEAAFWSLVKDWPNFATADKQRPLKLWMALPGDERLLATQRYPEWRRTFGSRTHIPMPSTYLAEKLWNAVDDPSPEALRPGIPNAWSKAWSALRLSELLKDPSTAMPTLTVYQRQELQAGGAKAEALKLDRLRNYGWPKVNTMHQRAQNAQGVSVPPAIVALSEAFVQLNRDSAEVARWKALHERNGWPWMPVPAKGVDWLFFPAGEPEEAIFEFQQAISEGRGNDDAA